LHILLLFLGEGFMRVAGVVVGLVAVAVRAFVPCAMSIRKNVVARFGLSKTEGFEVQNLLEKLGMVNGNDDYGNKKAITNQLIGQFKMMNYTNININDSDQLNKIFSSTFGAIKNVSATNPEYFASNNLSYEMLYHLKKPVREMVAVDPTLERGCLERSYKEWLANKVKENERKIDENNDYAETYKVYNGYFKEYEEILELEASKRANDTSQ
tara:strand:+ start:109 stop:744 length:636 start_codon:yes stop_codon:yes gene_type:complete